MASKFKVWAQIEEHPDGMEIKVKKRLESRL